MLLEKVLYLFNNVLAKNMKIAILEDDITQLQMAEQALFGGENYWDEQVDFRTFTSGLALLQSLKSEYYDCLILDRRVSDMSGDVILQWVRQYGIQQNKAYTAVIMLTNLRSEDEVIAGLNAGADDYVTKPFRPRELVARVQRLIRASKAAKDVQVENSFKDNGSDIEKDSLEMVIKINNYEFNQFEQTVTCNGEVIDLTEREFSLALLFFRNLGKPVSREAIFETVWKRANNPSSRALDTHIYRLRHALNLTAENGFVLRTVYGFGYRLDVAGPRAI